MMDGEKDLCRPTWDNDLAGASDRRAVSLDFGGLFAFVLVVGGAPERNFSERRHVREGGLEPR
jgi:hypothetical protein